MNYATAVPELFSRFPELEATYHARFAFMKDDEAIQYVIFGSILIPALTAALEEGDLGVILPICAFLEDASIAAHRDNLLGTPFKVEVAEWLGRASNEERLAPWLGAETKRLCNYVPGLAPSDFSCGQNRRLERSPLDSLQRSEVASPREVACAEPSKFRFVGMLPSSKPLEPLGHTTGSGLNVDHAWWRLNCVDEPEH